jgi:hypothetical protein
MSGYEDFVKAQRNVNAKLEQLRSANDRYDAASHRCTAVDGVVLVMVVVPFGCSTSKRPQVHLRRWRSATHHSFLIYRTYRQHADVRKFLASVLVERSGSRVAAAAEVGDADAHTQAMLDADAADAAEELSREEMEAVEMEAVEASSAKPARRLVDLDCHYDFRVVWDRVRQVFFAILPRPKRTRRAAAPPLSESSRLQRVVALDPNQRNLFGAFCNNGL